MENQEWVAALPAMSFRELMGEICWNWQPDNALHHDIVDHGDGAYSVDKLEIMPGRVSYKTDNWKITKEVYDKFVTFYVAVSHLLEPREDLPQNRV